MKLRNTAKKSYMIKSYSDSPSVAFFSLLVASAVMAGTVATFVESGVLKIHKIRDNDIKCQC